MFLQAHAAAGEYALAHARMIGGGVEVSQADQIKKRRLIVRDAWEVGVNDLDSMAILPADDPVVPEAAGAPPVAEVLKRIRNKC